MISDRTWDYLVATRQTLGMNRLRWDEITDCLDDANTRTKTYGAIPDAQGPTAQSHNTYTKQGEQQ